MKKCKEYTYMYIPVYQNDSSCIAMHYPYSNSTYFGTLVSTDAPHSAVYTIRNEPCPLPFAKHVKNAHWKSI